MQVCPSMASALFHVVTESLWVRQRADALETFPKTETDEGQRHFPSSFPFYAFQGLAGVNSAFM